MITAEELYNALSTSKDQHYDPSPVRAGRQSAFGNNKEAIEQILSKIRKAVSHYKSQQE